MVNATQKKKACISKYTLSEKGGPVRFSKANNWQVWEGKAQTWDSGNKARLCNPSYLEIYSAVIADGGDLLVSYFSRLSLGQSLAKIKGCCEGNQKYVTGVYVGEMHN